MHIHLDKHAHLHSPIHHWDPRFKIVSLFALILSISFLKKVELASFSLAISVFILLFSRLPIREILKKLKYPFYMLILLAILLTVTSGGQKYWTWGPLSIYQSGLYLGIVILIKSTAQLVIFFVLLDSTHFHRTIKALYVLKVPKKLVAIAFFTFRFIFVYLEELRKMQTAARLRGSRQIRGLRHLTTQGEIIGSLIIKSFEQAERIQAAMVMRGYTYEFIIHHSFRAEGSDYLKSAVILAIAASIGGAHLVL